MVTWLFTLGGLAIIVVEVVMRMASVEPGGRAYRILEGLWITGCALVLCGLAGALVGLPF